MYIIKLNNGNYVADISIDGRIVMCPLAYQAKMFNLKKDVKPYTDFIEREYSKFTYEVRGFDFTTYAVEY